MRSRCASRRPGRRRLHSGNGLPRDNTLHELTHATGAITPDAALRLDALLGAHAETWLVRQGRHDTHAERARTEAWTRQKRRSAGKQIGALPGAARASRSWTGAV